MVDTQARWVALLPIKPRFAEAIISGRKKVEFRKNPIRDGVRWVILYASRPVSKVVAYFEITTMDEGPLDDLWQRYSSLGAVNQKEYKDYFGEARRGVAIGVGKVYHLHQPQPLMVLGAAVAVPQSTVYLVPEVLETLSTFQK